MSEATTELAVHLAAATHGADAGALLDSAAFVAQVEALGPDTPGFVDRVSAAVREAVGAAREDRSAPAGGEQAAKVAPESAEAPQVALSRNELLARRASRRAQLTPEYAGEITAEDVRLADPWVVGEWAASGKLAHLGVPPQKRRGRR